MWFPLFFHADTPGFPLTIKQAYSIQKLPNITKPSSFQIVNKSPRGTRENVKELNEQFVDLLKKAGLDNKEITRIVNMYSDDHKELILELMAQHADKYKEEKHNPEEFIDKLKNNEADSQCLSQLALCLKYCVISWIEEFIKLEGIQLLCSLLAKTELSKDLDIQEQCILCLKAVVNCELGMNEFLKCSDSIKSLSWILEFSQVPTETKAEQFLRIRCLVMFLLCVICNYSEQGFWIVLDTMNHYKLVKREKVRFEHLATAFKTIPDLKHKAHCLALINTLITSANNQIIRSNIWSEFMSLDVFEHCSVWSLNKF